MNRQIRLILVLWTALVLMGSALAGDIGCCGPICCDEPCAPTAMGLDPCVCCALSGTVSDDPGLPAVPAAKAAPSPTAAPAPVVTAPDAPIPAPVVLIATADPPPSRPTVLRI